MTPFQTKELDNDEDGALMVEDIAKIVSSIDPFSYGMK
jgi:hypothetical protein